MLTPILLCLFFFSGMIALIYEVLWQRQLALLFGSAGPAAAAVLAAYFAGLAAGSWALGRSSRRWRRPLRAYAILEICIGAGALLVTPILNFYAQVYPALFQNLAAKPAIFLTAKLLLSFGALFLPTFFMGGALPLLADFMDGGQRKFGRTVGLYYAVNTAGAALGACLPAFWLLPYIDVRVVLAACVAGNVVLALLAWWLEKQMPPIPEAVATEASSHAKSSPAPSTIGRLSLLPHPLLALSCLSGFCAFALQVLWNRAFAQVHENSAHSFSLIAAIFILALAAGAWVARFELRRDFDSTRLLGLAWLGGGLLCSLGPLIFVRMTELEYMPMESTWIAHLLRLTGTALAVLALPMTLLGMGMPVLMERSGDRGGSVSAGSILGKLLAVNLVSAVAGALVAGFILPKTLGLWKSVIAIGGLLMFVGLGQLWAQAKKWRWAAAACVVGTLLALSGLQYPRAHLLRGEELIETVEGAHGTVAVVEDAESRRLKLNNHYLLGGTSSTGDERMQAHLPLLLHPAPRRVAFLGVGSGITASGALFHPFEQVDAIEIVPEVIQAARRHFAAANLQVLEDRKVRVIIEDARNFLRATGAKYDVIIGDLVVPWREGESALFRVEQFEAARQRLAPGGLFCQWLPLFQMSEIELRIVLKTFLSVFPKACVWRGDFSPHEPALALMSGLPPFELDPAQALRRLKEFQAKPDPANPQLLEPAGYWMHFAGLITDEDLKGEERRINSENRPWLEFLGPRQHIAQNASHIFAGKRLQEWLKELRLKSIDRLPMLGEDEKSAWQAGLLLGDLTVNLSEGNDQGARALHAKLAALIPKRLLEIIFPSQ